MSEFMTAAVLYEPGDIRVERVPVCTPGSGDLLVEVAACGVCGSDIPRMNFSGAHRHPIICGHEFSGHVVRLGPEANGFAEGDLVSVPPLLPCNKCESCLAGNFSLCENYDYFGSRRDGAYAQFVVVPAGNAIHIPKGMDPRAAAMLDPAAIALHAIRRTKLAAGQRVAVIGSGAIGLFAIQWARLMGATEVLAVDVNEQKARMATQAGATQTANNDADAIELSGKGYDVVIESAGVARTITLAVNIAARHGEAAFIGIPHTDVTFDEKTFTTFLRKEISLHGSWNSFSAPFPGAEWTDAVKHLADGSLKWEFMITHELGLDALPDIMKQLAERSMFSSKILFLPNAE